MAPSTRTPPHGFGRATSSPSSPLRAALADELGRFSKAQSAVSPSSHMYTHAAVLPSRPVLGADLSPKSALRPVSVIAHSPEREALVNSLGRMRVESPFFETGTLRRGTVLAPSATARVFASRGVDAADAAAVAPDAELRSYEAERADKIATGTLRAPPRAADLTKRDNVRVLFSTCGAKSRRTVTGLSSYTVAYGGGDGGHRALVVV